MQQFEYGKSERQVKLLAVAGVLMLAELLFLLTRLPGDNVLFIIGLGFILAAAFNKTSQRFMALLQQHPKTAMYLQALGKVFYLNCILAMAYAVIVNIIGKLGDKGMEFADVLLIFLKYGPLSALKSVLMSTLNGEAYLRVAVFALGYTLIYFVTAGIILCQTRRYIQSGSSIEEKTDIAPNKGLIAKLWATMMLLLLALIILLRVYLFNCVLVFGWCLGYATICVFCFLPWYQAVIIKPSRRKFWIYGLMFFLLFLF